MRPLIPATKTPEPPPPNCLNCGADVPLADRFCGKCGQENEASPVSFTALLREVWEAFVQIDATLLRTLRFLVFRPGFLSAEYVRGRRGAYLSPFKMYLAVSAFFFLLWAWTLPFDRLQDMQAEAAKAVPVRTTDVADRKKLPKFDTRTAPPPEDDLVKGLRQFRDKPMHVLGYTFSLDSLPKSVVKYRKTEQNKPIVKRDSPTKHFVTERMILFVNDPAGSARNLFSTALPFQLLIQLPLFAVWMRLIYFRQKRLYVEHLVFLLHTHAFFFLLFGTVLFANVAAKSLGTTVPLLQHGATWLILTAAITIYNLLAYRRFYEQSWGKTLSKGWFLLNGYLLLQLFTASIATLVSLIWTLLTAG